MALLKQNAVIFRVTSLLNKIVEDVESEAISEVEKGSRFCNWILK